MTESCCSETFFFVRWRVLSDFESASVVSLIIVPLVLRFVEVDRSFVLRLLSQMRGLELIVLGRDSPEAFADALSICCRTRSAKASAAEQVLLN